MIEVKPDENSNTVYTIAVDTLTVEDMRKVLPVIEQKIDKYGKAKWYFEMNNFKGWEMKAFWDDIKFDLRHANDYERVAIVGEKKWQEWMTQIMKPFTDSDIRYYDIAEREDAKAWLQK